MEPIPVEIKPTSKIPPDRTITKNFYYGFAQEPFLHEEFAGIEATYKWSNLYSKWLLKSTRNIKNIDVFGPISKQQLKEPS